MTINSILSVARSALLTHQAAIEVTGHNIANAETPGYSRQDVQLAASAPSRTPIGTFGTGVSIVNVARAHDTLAAQQLRTQTASAAGFGTRSALLQRIEAVFGEPSDTGLASSLDAFWNAWSDLSSHPDNAGARAAVQQRALALTDQFNSYATRLAAIAADTTAGVGDTVTRANQITTDVAALNVQIVAAESSGNTAGDLRDTRDRLVNELAAIVPVQVIDRADGSTQVMSGGMPLVDGAVAHRLSVKAGPPIAITRGNDPAALIGVRGALGAMLDVVNTDIPAALSALDAIAAALVTDVNEVHARGWSPPAGAGGNWDPLNPPTGSGVDFFDAGAGNATARTIRLSATVAADAGAIAASDALDEPGNNRIALELARLREFAPTAPGNSFGEAYRDLVTRVGSATQAANDSTNIAQTLLTQAASRHASATGVSTDEELLRLMRHQQAYAAAAKLVQVADEMALTLLSLKV